MRILAFIGVLRRALAPTSWDVGGDAGALQGGLTYYWRVDASNSYGTVLGWTSRFTVE